MSTSEVAVWMSERGITAPDDRLEVLQLVKSMDTHLRYSKPKAPDG